MPQVYNWLFHLLFAVFGTGSWLAINGIFSELSFLVQTAPESWNLASGLTLTIQLGNIIPFAYVLLGRFKIVKQSEHLVIYLILAVGCISSVLLAFLWDKTEDFGGASHSFYLYLFTFTLAAVDCTSSVTYFPFMAKFPETFIVSLMIGEGLSGLIPSVLALAQNGGTVKKVSDSSTYQELTSNSTEGPSNSTYCYTNANFSEKTYFMLIFALFFVSGLAFFLINILPNPMIRSKPLCTVKRNGNSATSSRSTYTSENGSDDSNFDREAEPLKTLIKSKNPSCGVNNQNTNVTDLLDTFEHSVDFHLPEDEEDNDVMNPITIPVPTTVNSSTSFLHSIIGTTVTKTDLAHFTFLFVVCFLFNGALPSISTYILLPYGNEEMLVISNIGNIANPLTCIVLMFLPLVSSIRLSAASSILTLISSLILTYFAIAAPPFVGNVAGSIATGTIWVFFKIVATVARLVQANFCKSRSKEHLFLYGAVTQAGSFFGALVFYILVNYTSVFVQVYASC
ncbi:riboflavin transporter 2-like [Convolutriloba macropyga]|uniref:riboflavin transporter 2-like n=1 Tax=Convolutriloba macropyga TaxID=536237 RepID=UPI003F520AB9